MIENAKYPASLPEALDAEKLQLSATPLHVRSFVAIANQLVASYNPLAESLGLETLPTEVCSGPGLTVNSSIVETIGRNAKALVDGYTGDESTAGTLLYAGATLAALLAQTYALLHGRLDGDATHGIPARPFGQTADPAVPETLPYLLSTALPLLNDRKISNGTSDDSDGIPDGISLAQICCGANGITKIDDSNHGWTCVRQFPNIFPSLKELTLNCSGTLQYMVLINGSPIEKLNIPEVTEILEGNSSQGGMTFGNSNNSLKEIHAESLLRYTGGYSASICNALEEFDAPSCEYYDQTISFGGLQAPNIKIFRLGTLTHLDLYRYPSNPEPFSTYLDLIHFEVGKDTALSLDLSPWSPTNALDASRTDLIEQGSEAENNLQQFLLNFKTYIAGRLAKYTGAASGKPLLTLSAAVYSAVIEGADQICNEIKGIIEDQGWKVQDTNNHIFPTT